MNAITSAIQPALPREPFDAAAARVNEWRGACLHSFARAEAAVSECLAKMASVPGRGSTVGLPHLVGQKHEALFAAIRSEGPFASEGEESVPLLEQFRTYDRLRTMLCHGLGEISLDRHGQWTVVLRTVSLRCRKAERDSLALSHDEAMKLQAELARVSQSLSAKLGQLRSRLEQSKA